MSRICRAMTAKKYSRSHLRIAVVNDIEQGPAQRLKEARKIAKGGFFKHATDAARFFGWDEGTYRGHEAGTRNYPPDVAMTYSRAFGVTAGWLMFGEGINPTSQNLRKRPTIGALPLPLLRFSDFFGVYKMIDVERIIEGAEKFVEVPAIVNFGKLAFTLTAEDDSMVQIPPDPSLSPGDNFPLGTYLPFDPAVVIKPGDYILARFNNETLFRKYREVGTDEGKDLVDLIPLNNNYPRRRGVINENIFIIARLQADFRKR